MAGKKADRMTTGTLLGILVPFLTLWIYVQIRFDGLAFIDFLRGYFRMGILTHVISLSVIANLLLFFGFIQANYLRAARGVLLATFIFAFAVLIIRFI